ncbi:hypothetical protein M408DRAFT_328726 [Serendipita vermifera MAFF 305830]|uniref:Nucleolar protein 9 n=1 Tax=Serendipita vermifera MAFF 305830 TaxID=933852 RepID=A0A0C3BBG5_SERVB|nr:hypothetical protein M408DRAFT_328726 [Serendipita vermifera MAFF 305830]
MPREHRKRGKRKKTAEDTDVDPVTSKIDKVEEEQPSWIEIAASTDATYNPEAPFGFCDPDVKAYFRTVDKQLLEWQEAGIENNAEVVEDPNLERRMFFAAALAEMQGKERQLATDPDCAVILERMIHSMDDLARRIFANSLLGSIVELSKHRFGSHVLETLLENGSQTIDRESKGIYPTAQSLPHFAAQPTFIDLVASICKETTPVAVSLVNEPFASHVLRRLFITLVPALGVFQEKQEIRSKRSAGYKAKVGPMKSVFDSSVPEFGKEVPTQFELLAKDLLDLIRTKLSPSEVRALAADKVACPTLRVMIALEANIEGSDVAGSLMDSVLAGMITHLQNPTPTPYVESDYIGTLLRDATASHLLETLISHTNEKVIETFWDTYMAGKLSRLVIHPVANFVVAATFARLEGDRLASSIHEMSKIVSKCLKLQRIGPVTAMVERVAKLGIGESEVVQTICQAIGVGVNEPQNLLKQLLGMDETANNPDKSLETPTRFPKSTASVQGALLLQAMLHLQSPHNEIVIQSFDQLLPKERLSLAHDATSSRVIDAMFESPRVSRKSKRSIIMSFLGEYHLLVDDRIGSRVGDRCWANADPYLKEKIARSLIAHQQFLTASYYGKFFSRKLQLSLLQRRPDEWKKLQTNVDQKPITGDPQPSQEQTNTQEKPDNNVSLKRKRKRDEQKDEIDVLFDGVKENRFSKVVATSVKQESQSQGVDLDPVLKAIKTAPKGETSKRRKG